MNVGPAQYSLLCLKAKDASEIAALERACFPGGWTAEQYRGLLGQTERADETGPPGMAPWMIWGIREKNGGLVAYLCLGVYSGTAELEILNFAVQETFRRQGLGRALLRHVLEWGFRHGFERVFLEAREGNTAALALYALMGFARTGRREKYYSDTGEAALTLCCAIRQRPWKKHDQDTPEGDEA